MTHIIVHRTHPIQYFAIRMLLLLLTALLLWGAFELGYMQSEEDIIKAKGGRKSLLVQQIILQKNNNKLSKEVLHLERKYLLEKESCQLVQQTINQDKIKMSELEKELSFYKAILSSSKRHESLYLQSLEIQPYLEQPVAQKQKSGKNKQTGNLYQYHFVLAQQIKKKGVTRGVIKVSIMGEKDKKKVNLSLSSLRIPLNKEKKFKDKVFKFSFKYFQEFKGIIKLPEDVVVHSIDIAVDSQKKKSIFKLADLKWSQAEGIKYVGQ